VSDPLEQTIRLDAVSHGPKRSANYRQWAAEADARADDTDSSELRDAYRSLARSWLQMAADAERKY
jgi:hypothetical protein